MRGKDHFKGWMNMKKIVGYSSAGDSAEGKYRIDSAYVNKIVAAGAIPIMLPPTDKADDLEAIVDMCDGILLTGGPDINPEIYGEAKLAECGEISAERDANELALCRISLEKKKPLLAICRGIQVLNVACGGTLWQDIPSQIAEAGQHATANGIKAEHTVLIVDEKAIARFGFADNEFSVNSFHHQAIKEIGKDLCVIATSKEDGIIEAVSKTGEVFTLGVQWHPERLDNDRNAKAIFESFVKAL